MICSTSSADVGRRVLERGRGGVDWTRRRACRRRGAASRHRWRCSRCSEAPGFSPPRAGCGHDLHAVSDSHLLEVHNQVTARDATVVLELGDLLMGARDAALHGTRAGPGPKIATRSSGRALSGAS